MKSKLSRARVGVGVLFLSVCTSACTTVPPKRAEVADLAHASGVETGVLVSYSMTASSKDVRERGCELVLRHTGLGQEVAFLVRTDEKVALLALEPGNYVGLGLLCGGGKKKWRLDHFLEDAFEVEKGKLTYVGHLNLGLDSTGANLQFSVQDRLKDTQGLAAILRAMPKAAQDRVRIAYTQKPVELEATQGASTGFKIKAEKFSKDPGRAQKLDAELVLAELQKCENDDRAEAPVRIGRLELTATYLDGKLQSIEDSKSRHAFRDSFVECVRSALAALDTGAIPKVELHLEY